MADRMKRDAILIELNADYCAMAKKRIQADAPLFTPSVEIEGQAADHARNILFCIGAPELAGVGKPLWVSEIDPHACHVPYYRFGASRPQAMPDPQEAGAEEAGAKEADDRRLAIRAVADLPETAPYPIWAT